jgi:2,3-bisphosphoglycerate-dependent phosphoglycerate mutase
MINTRLILVRHAETEANKLQRWYGALDAPLTEKGMRQVEATARRLADYAARKHVDVLYVSPLPRAIRTAAAIGLAIHHQPIVEEGLREFSIGDWEGRTYRDLIENEQLWRRWAIDPAFAPPNGESPHTFGLRAEAAAQAIVDRHPGATVVAVAHGGIIGAVLDAWLGGGVGEWARWEPHNCAVSVLEFDGQRWKGLVVNDISHLPADAREDERPAYFAEFAPVDGDS